MTDPSNGRIEHVTHEVAGMSISETYGLMIRAIVPRPIAFVTSVDASGVVNLAPFSFFNGVSSNPPCLVFAVTRKPDGGKKDTLLNIEATREFVVNSTHEWLAEKINQCSATYPHGVSEMEKVGFTPLPSVGIKPPRVAESLIQMECVLEHLLEIGDGSVGSATLVVGRIQRIHVSPDALGAGGKIDAEKLRPLARLGGQQWSKLGEVFEQARPRLETASPPARDV